MLQYKPLLPFIASVCVHVSAHTHNHKDDYDSWPPPPTITTAAVISNTTTHTHLGQRCWPSADVKQRGFSYTATKGYIYSVM